MKVANNKRSDELIRCEKTEIVNGEEKTITKFLAPGIVRNEWLLSATGFKVADPRLDEKLTEKQVQKYAVNHDWQIVTDSALIENVINAVSARFIGSKEDCEAYVVDHKPVPPPPTVQSEIATSLIENLSDDGKPKRKRKK